jgi:hypothetical protein
LTRVVAVLAAPLVFAACSVFAQPGAVVDGWRYPAPAPLPPGAMAVEIDVAPIPSSIPPNIVWGCPAALLGPFNLLYVPGDVATPVHYTQVPGGAEIHVRWQPGISARHSGRLEIVGPDGAVIAAEGGPVDGLGGGFLGNDNTFTVCLGQYHPTRVGP